MNEILRRLLDTICLFVCMFKHMYGRRVCRDGFAVCHVADSESSLQGVIRAKYNYSVVIRPLLLPVSSSSSFVNETLKQLTEEEQQTRRTFIQDSGESNIFRTGML